MSASVALKAEIDALRASVKPLMDRIDALQEQLREVQSREWIAANDVRLGDVAIANANGVPYFSTLRSFGDWLGCTGSTKRWVEWNGYVHAAAEVIAGRTFRRMPGRIEHVAP